MSLSYLNSAFKAKIGSSSAKFVLVALCDYANEEGCAYPSVQTLCAKTDLNRKTVISQIDYLVKNDFLTDTGNRKGRTKSVKEYRINKSKLDFSSPKNGTAKQSQNWDSSKKQAVPKTELVKGGSSPKNGTAKQSQNWDTEPSVLLTTSIINHQRNNACEKIWCDSQIINQSAWSDFEQHRIEVKKPLTDLSRKTNAKIIRGLSHSEQRDCVDMTISNSWRGLFPEKIKQKNNYEKNQRNNTKFDAAVEIANAPGAQDDTVPF